MNPWFSWKSATILLTALLLITLAAGAVIQRADEYHNASLPDFDTLQKSFYKIRGSEDLRLEELVGKTPLEKGGWQFYYYVKDNQGNLFVDDKLVLIKLDTDVWIMRIRNANNDGEQWGIVTKY